MDDGSTWFVVVGVVLLVGVLGFLVRGTEAQRLRRMWFRNTPLPRPQAEESLARHLMALKERFPGQKETWYLRRVLADLKRDRS